MKTQVQAIQFRPAAATAAWSARIQSVEPDRRVTVTRGERVMRARLAVAGPYAATVGDEVLILEADDGECYVIGVLQAPGRLLFERRAAEGKAVLEMPTGDLEIRAGGGALTVVGRDAVRLIAPLLDARARRGEVTLEEGRLIARTLSTAVETVRHAAEIVESRVGRLVERVKNAYREVEDLSQTRAGRIKLVATASFHLLGKRAHLKAEEDLKLKSNKKIHLA